MFSRRPGSTPLHGASRATLGHFSKWKFCAAVSSRKKKRRKPATLFRVQSASPRIAADNARKSQNIGSYLSRTYAHSKVLIIRHMHFKPFAILFLFLFQISAFAAIHKHNLKKDVEFLASDQMKGRLTGTPEARKAAEYIAAEFQAAGLGVPPSASAFQSFEFTSGIKLGSNNALSADFKGARQSYVLSKDFIPVGFSEEGQLVNVPVVFAGYGIRAADKKYDNYAGLD